MATKRRPIPISNVAGARYTLLADKERRYALGVRREASTLEIAWEYRDKVIRCCRARQGTWQLQIDHANGITAIVFSKSAPNAESGYRFAVDYIDKHWPTKVVASDEVEHRTPASIKYYWVRGDDAR